LNVSLTLNIQRHQKSFFFKFFFNSLSVGHFEYFATKKISTFSKIDDFIQHVPVQANLLLGTIIFLLKFFFYSESKKLKRVLLAFEICF